MRMGPGPTTACARMHFCVLPVAPQEGGHAEREILIALMARWEVERGGGGGGRSLVKPELSKQELGSRVRVCVGVSSAAQRTRKERKWGYE